ncbi:efflux RND transporter periplasmic adaptor subunit [Roseiterribacter gracilis]
MDRRRIVLGVALVLAAAVAVWVFLPHGKKQQAQQARPPIPVPVITIGVRNVPIYREFVGYTRALNTIDVRARVAGYLVERKVKEGADVEAGQVLYQIDPRDYQAAVQRAEAAVLLSKQNVARTEPLAARGFSSRQTLDQQVSQQKQDEAALRTAQLNLEYTTVKAPFAGRVGRTEIDVGGLVSEANTKLTSLVQLDPIYAYFTPSDAELAEINQARAVGPVETQLLFPSSDDPVAVGQLDFVDNAVDRSTGTVAMRGVFRNSRKIILPGQFVHVRVKLRDEPNGLLIPQSALGSNQQGKFVYVVSKDNKVEERQIKLGSVFNASQLVLDGVAAGDRLIISGLQNLFPGTPVDPKEVATP